MTHFHEIYPRRQTNPAAHRQGARIRDRYHRIVRSAPSDPAAASSILVNQLRVQLADLQMNRRELQESKERMEMLNAKFAELYDFSPIGYLTVNPQGRILEANLTSAALLGRQRPLLLLGTLSDYVAPEDRPSLKSVFAKAFSSYNTESHDIYLRRPDTTFIWANLHFRPALTHADLPELCQIAISDITHIRTARADRAKQIVHAQKEERTRISRELHDEVSQTLVGVQLHLQVLARQADASPIALSRTVARTQRMVEKSVNSIHSFARELRPAPLEELGLLAAMSTLVEDFASKTGLAITFKPVTEIPHLAQEVQTALYRVAQAAISNVARHAGFAEIEISLTARPGAVCLIIRDNGRGFNVKSRFDNNRRKRLGLMGMSERIELVGGSMTIESAPGKGTTIQACVPFGQQSVADLSPREAEVLQRIAEGRANKHIAADLGISVKTVEKHRHNLMKKLNIHETAGLTRHAISTGLIENGAPLSTC